jgi:hypothetical protein
VSGRVDRRRFLHTVSHRALSCENQFSYYSPCDGHAPAQHTVVLSPRVTPTTTAAIATTPYFTATATAATTTTAAAEHRGAPCPLTRGQRGDVFLGKRE